MQFRGENRVGCWFEIHWARDGTMAWGRLVRGKEFTERQREPRDSQGTHWLEGMERREAPRKKQTAERDRRDTEGTCFRSQGGEAGKRMPESTALGAAPESRE